MPPKNRQSLRPPPMRRSATPLPGMNLTRSALPAEIIATILDYLPVSSLMTFARVSHRLQEMVYDDTRWVSKLQLIGVWNEAEARARFEEAMRRKRAANAAKRAEEERQFAEKQKAKGQQRESTLFDAAEEQQRAAVVQQEGLRGAGDVKKAGDVLGGEGTGGGGLRMPTLTNTDPDSLLNIFKSVRSVRGFARLEFARIYAALAPLYFDLVKAKSHADPEVFRIYRDPEKQARVLALLKAFSECDTAMGWIERTERLKAMTAVFENAALREFEGGYEEEDVDGRMRRYAHVLIMLNGGYACVQLFVQKHPVLYERGSLGNPMDCFDNPSSGVFSLEPSKEFFRKLSQMMLKQAATIDRVFPPSVNVLLPFLERVGEDVITEYVTPILDEAHDRNIDEYLKAVAGLYKQCQEFGASLTPTKGSGDRETFQKDVSALMGKVFDAHADLYLQEELDHFRKKAEAEVENWEKKITEQDAATESFFMSNINREADKRDFLTSFKKVILAPVYVIPSALTAATPRVETPRPTLPSEDSDWNPNPRLSVAESRPGTPAGNRNSLTPRAPSPAAVPPTTELAAKTAIMNSRLEGIRTLFSLEVSLHLVHLAKESLERAAVFARVPGQTGEEAREQCEAIFTTLLHILGPRHVKAGFEKAVLHLGSYNPREHSNSATSSSLAPLVTFLELVNVGDLIQQMIDVFYEQELVANRLTDRNDFLNPAAKEKKRFEQMLDDQVAAGLNTGIDALIAEVEHIFATTQMPGDFNPPPGKADHSGPSETAQKVVEFIKSHTALLVGSTDKNVLEVFNSEVGLRLFTAICKHIKRQRISVDGAIRLISDINLYHEYIKVLKIAQLAPFYTALREIAQLYLIDAKTHAKAMASVIADQERFKGVFRVEEVYEYAARREDWYTVRKDVERAMYGFGCGIM